jgi:uncharacterized protein (TIGR03067 family)
MTMKTISCFAVLLALSLVMKSEAGDDKELKKLEGTWKLVSGEQGDKEIPAELLKTAKLVIKGDKHFVTMGGKEIVGTHKLDPTTKPKSIDATDGDSKMLGIYEIKGDTFKVCFAEPGKDRPKDFKAGNFWHVWKRVKK